MRAGENCAFLLLKKRKLVLRILTRNGDNTGMSELVTTISHQGREIIFLNCAGREEADILRGFDDMLDTVIGSSVPTKALVLVDMSNTFSSMAVSKKGRDTAERGKRAACLICLPRLLVSGVYKRQ